MTSRQNVVASNQGIISSFTINPINSTLNDENYRFEYCKSTPNSCQQLSLLRNSPCKLSLPPIGEWELICSKNIKEVSTGKIITCVLLQYLKEQQVSFIIVSKCSDKLLPLRRYVVDSKKPVKSKTKLIYQNIQIIDGPSLMWVSSSQLHFALSSSTSCDLQLKTVQLNRLTYPDRSYDNFALLCCYDFINKSLIIGRVFKNADGIKNSEYFCVVFYQNFNSFQTIDTSRILPLPYSTTIQHVCILDCCMTGNPSESQLFQCDNELQVRMLVFTEEKYLLEVLNGKLLRCFHIPQQQTSFSCLTTLDQGYQCSLPILLTSDHQAYVIDVQLTKVKFVIKDVDQIFVQDFLQRGSSQVLFLGSHSNEEQMEEEEDKKELANFWLLTDFDFHHFQHGNTDMRKDMLKERPEFGDGDLCPPAVCQVLLQQIQQDFLTFEEKNRLIKERNQFITDIWQLLGVEANTSHLPPESMKPPGMMTFIKGSPRVEASKKIQRRAMAVDIVEVWQKIVADKWIIGVDFRTSRKFQNISVLVVSDQENNNILASSTSLRNNSSTISKSSTITTTTDTAGSQTGIETVTCTLHALPKIGIKPSSKFFVFLQVSECKWRPESNSSTLLPCGCISFDLETLLHQTPHQQQILSLSDSIPSKELRRSLIALNSVLNCWKFFVKSRLTSLTSMKDWLHSCAELSWAPSLERFVFVLTESPFKHVQLTVLSSHPHQCSIHIYAPEESFILPVIHFLYSRLPDDVIILPETGSASELPDKRQVAAFLQSLHGHLQEVEAIFSKFSQNNNSDDSRAATTTVRSSSSLGHQDEESREMTSSILKKMRLEGEAKRKTLKDRWILKDQQLKEFAAAWHNYQSQYTITPDIFANI
ncbi:uncharacterized protein LOC115218231 isoform X1 [Argonauta hians]